MLYYKTMNTETIVMCVVALILGMLMANMLKNVCGCKSVVEGLWKTYACPGCEKDSLEMFACQFSGGGTGCLQ